MALMGPTGSGKTYTSLILARHLTDGPILIIDTERSSAGLYAEELNPDGRIEVIELDDFTPITYTRALEWAAAQKYACVIVDSGSHAWQGTKDEVDRVAKRSGNGNSFAAWREVSPQHNALVDTMIRFPGHIIVTLRVKTEWLVETINGKSVPKKVGLQPEQKDGIEYEFDFAATMDEENTMIVTKTRAVRFRGLIEKHPGISLAERLREWCESGIPLEEGMQETDPLKAIKLFALTNTENDRLRQIAKERGYHSADDWKQIVLNAWNAGRRGSIGLEQFVQELPVKQSGNGGDVATQDRPKGEQQSSTSPQNGQAGGQKDSATTRKTANATSAKPPTTPSGQSTTKPEISGSANAHETGSYFYATDPNFNKFVNISGELGWPQEPPQLLAIACELGKIGLTKSLQDIPAARWAKIAEAAEAVKLGDQPEPKAAKP